MKYEAGERSPLFMTEEERRREIARLEAERADIVRELEECMREYSKASGAQRFKTRKYKLGSSPNDISG